jgi:hypothetical protein
LGDLRWLHNQRLQCIVNSLSDRVAQPGMRLGAIDSTVDSVFGKQIEAAYLGYNPYKPGRNSCHPIIAIDVTT